MKPLKLFNYSDFLSRHDPVWQFQPQKWGEGAFLGNGFLGAMVYSGGTDQHRLKNNVLRWELGRVEVTAQGDRSGYLEPRVLIGDFLLEPRGIMTWEDCRMRLDLWNAELTGTVPVVDGKIHFRSFVHATRGLIVVELEGMGSEADPCFNFHPQHGVSPWVHFREGEALERIPVPPEPVADREGETRLSVQTFLTGGQCVVAWRSVETDRGKKRIFISIDHDDGGTIARTRAVTSVADAVTGDWDALVAEHRAWWHDYYPSSFISIPDTRLEAFYWIQIYKMGAAARPDAPVLDVLGPWMTLTPWPGVWWNLNAQFIYAPYYVSNRHFLARSLSGTLERNMENLIANAPEEFRFDSAALGRASTYDCSAPTGPGWELGNLTWLCFYLWRHYRMTMDTAFLKRLVFPLLKRSINLYLHLLEEGSDGHLHLPPTHSPEYSGHQNLTTRDCHYDLALLRWGCRALIEAAERLDQHDGPQLRRWHEVLEKLTPFPVDATGFKVGADLPFSYGHRHFCHLMAGYPLFVMDPDNPNERALLKQSLETWLAREGALSGFSFTYAASAYAHFGEGDKAVRCLEVLLDHYLHPNTMYAEKGPVLETPLHGAEVVHDLLLQSNRGAIHVFPAVPKAWEEASFADLAAEGGFLVTAVRKEGRTRFIKIQSLAGQPCRVRCDLVNPEARILQGGILSLNSIDEELSLTLEKGETALLHERGDTVDPEVGPVPGQENLYHYYGSPKPWRIKGNLSETEI